MLCSLGKPKVGIDAYRVCVANKLDNKGDTVSFTVVYTEEAKAEVKRVLNSREFYVGTNGKMNFSGSTDTVNYVLLNMTR